MPLSWKLHLSSWQPRSPRTPEGRFEGCLRSTGSAAAAVEAPQPSSLEEKFPEAAPGKEIVPEEQPAPEPASKTLPQVQYTPLDWVDIRRK